MNWASDLRKVLRTAGAVLVLLAAGCGGGGGAGDATPAPAPQASGAVAGVAVVAGGQQLTLRGATGLGRIVTLRADGGFAASLSRLGGPYVAHAPVFDADTGTMLDLYAWSADAQAMSLNPLSTLQLAVLARQDPRTVYGSVSQWAGVRFDAAQQAAADEAVADYLQQYLGVPVPADVRGFATRMWQHGSGDAFDTVSRALLAAALARGEDLGALALRLGRRSAACARQSAGVTVDGVARRLCPQTVTRGADPADATVELHRFDGDEDGVLEIAVQAGAVVSIVHTLPDGRSYACAGPDCGNANVPDGRSFTLALALPAADGQGGSTRLDGTLISAAGPGTVLPAAECRSNRVSVGGGSLPAQAECAAIDEFGQGAQFSSPRGGSQRFGVDFVLPASSRVLSATLRGTGVTSLVLSEFDAVAGQTVYYACAGAGCQGVQVGTAAPDPLDVGWLIQPLQLAGTTLARLRDDGSTDPGDTRVLDAQLRAIIDPALARNLPTDCSAITPFVAATVDEDANAYGICPAPDDPSAATIVLEADGVTRTVLARSANFESVAVTLDADGQALRVVLDTNNGQRFGCGRVAAGEPACSGVLLSEPESDGARTLSFADTSLGELLYGDFVGVDRSARLSGAARIPAVP